MPPPAENDPSASTTRTMMVMMPFFSIVYGGFIPAGLFVYWIASSVFSIVQQFLYVGWGHMFPFFGWTPAFAHNHTPRFPVTMPPVAAAGKSLAANPAHSPTTAGCRRHQRSGPTRAGERADEGDDADMTAFRDAYQEFTGKTVEEALKAARDEFGVGLDGLDFEILTPGSRGVLGMGAEPARVLAAPRSALGGAAPKLEAAAQVPLPAAPPRDRDRDRDRARLRPRPRTPTRLDATTGARPRLRSRSRSPTRTPTAGRRRLRPAIAVPRPPRPEARACPTAARAPAAAAADDRDRGGRRPGSRPRPPPGGPSCGSGA